MAVSWFRLGNKLDTTVLFNPIGHRYMCQSVHSTLTVLKCGKSSMFQFFFLQNCLLMSFFWHFYLEFEGFWWSTSTEITYFLEIRPEHGRPPWNCWCCAIIFPTSPCPLLSVHCPSCSSSLSNLDPLDLLEPHVSPWVVGYIPEST